MLVDSMICLDEAATVEETRRLVPNLPHMTRALFGTDAHLSPRSPRHSDWITGNIKVGDGLVWLPWDGELWLIEAEWKEGKEGSNFFDQSRAFAKSKVDVDKLKAVLRNLLERQRDVLNKAVVHFSRDEFLDGIVELTLGNHLKHGYFCPHAWVILGGGEDNRTALRDEYEAELKARFVEPQCYILSSTRVFQNTLFIVMEQRCSESLPEEARPAGSLLVSGILPKEELSVSQESVPPAEIETQHPEGYSPEGPVSEDRGISSPLRGVAAREWENLQTIMRESGIAFAPDDYGRVRLGLHVGGGQYEYCLLP